MEKISGSDLMQRVKKICSASVDAGIDILNEAVLLKAETYQLVLLDACLHYEIQHSNRATMIQNLKTRIRKLERI